MDTWSLTDQSASLPGLISKNTFIICGSSEGLIRNFPSNTCRRFNFSASLLDFGKGVSEQLDLIVGLGRTRCQG